MDEINAMRQELTQCIESKNLPLSDNSIVQKALQTEQQIELLLKKHN